MLGIKRRRSRSADKPRKSRKPSPKTDHLDDEEDVQSILAKIRQQEEKDSEALAKKLQQEFDELTESKTTDFTEHHEAVESASGHDGPSTIEADEALARRLALEWEQQDAAESVPLDSNSNAIDGGISYPLTSNADTSFSRPANSFQSAPAFLTRVTDPEEDLLQHRELFTQSRNCTKCNKSVASPRGQVVFSPTIPPFSLLALLHAACDHCGQSHCRGCFRALTCSKSCKGKNCDVSSCCAEVRAIALFEALGGFDMQYIVEKGYSVSKGKRTSHPGNVSTVGPGGTGYSTSSFQGNPMSGLALNHRRVEKEDRQVAATREAVAARWDHIILRALDTIAYFLPSPYVDDTATFDLLPHPSIRPLISMSYLPELLGSLLINDSVNDWIARNDVYNSLLKLLRRMADSELSVRVLVGGRWSKKKSVGIENWMWEDGSIEWEKHPTTKEVVIAPPLYDHFRTLTKQCQTFLAGASRLLATGDDSVIEDLTVRATSLCADMISAQEDMQRALSVIMQFDIPEQPGESSEIEKGKKKDPNVEMEKNYCAAWEDLAFMHVPLFNDLPDGTRYYPHYHFTRLVEETESSTRQPAKRFHLIKEISATSTSLPPGVWVRVDEVRNDIMKIMIAGPEGTPYAGGLFEFDCFLPLDFPERPPKMNLATTGHGKVRFNPNLYADGKVCLSLLGTWPGSPEEQWSSKSTLLQVLVSIQSMILVEAPYFNEPGMGQVNMKNEHSIEYNVNVSRNTVRWAMVEWMKEEHRNGIWKEVIASHFSIRRQKIRECIHNWAKSDPAILDFHKSRKSPHSAIMLQPSSYNRKKTSRRVGGMETDHEGGVNLLDEFDKGCDIIEGWIAKDSGS